MGKLLSSFVHTRTRLQRLKDAKFFSGWVMEFDAQEIRVRLSTSDVCDPGDRFMIEIYGTEQIATLEGAATVAFENQIHLNVISSMSWRPNNENARYSVKDMFGTVLDGEIESECKVTDISKGGVGIVLRSQLTRKGTVKLKLTTPVGEIRGEGEVRYCRPDPGANGAFRAGIMLGELSRLEKARWMRLLEGDFAA